METTQLDRTLQDAIAAQHYDEALAQAGDLRPIDIAEQIKALPPDHVWPLLERLPNRAKVFAYIDNEHQARLLKTCTAETLLAILREMPGDDRVDLFKLLDQDKRNALLPELAHTEREYLRRMSSYAEGTAGAIMTSEYATLAPNLFAKTALVRLRKEAPDAETIYYIFIIDDERQLLGVVSLRQLILAEPDTRVSELMEEHVITAHLDDSQEAVADLIARYDLLTLPILNDKEQLVGIVTYDDAMDADREEATIDIQKTAGVTTLIENIKETSLGLLYKKRVFWLVLLVFGNILSGLGIAHFEEIIESNIVLVFFLPLLIDSGGNAGSQSSTLMVRALATGEVLIKDWFKLLTRESLVALALGLTMAVTVSVIGWYRGGMDVALIVSLSMVAIVLIGCLIGMSLPFLLSHFGLDPASSSAPLITSICDVSGVLIYLYIASQILHLPL